MRLFSALSYSLVHSHSPAMLVDCQLRITPFLRPGVSIGAVTMPAQRVQGETAFKIEQNLRIADAAAFQKFLGDYINSKSLKWQLTATITVSPTVAGIALPAYSNIEFNKVVTLTGFDNMKQITILGVSLTQLLPPTASSQINLFNPSIASMQIAGTSVFALKLKGQMIAEMSMPPFTLQRGGNPLTSAVAVKLTGPGASVIPGVMDVKDLLAEIYATSKLGGGAGASLPIQVTGLSVQNAAADYLNTVIRAIDITIPFPLELITQLLPGFSS
jgi:hypothetical protein